MPVPAQTPPCENLVRAIEGEPADRAVRESRPFFDLIEGRFVIAGGWVRDRFEIPPRESKDVDMFFATSADRDAAEVLLIGNGGEYETEGSRQRETITLNGVNYDLVHGPGMTSVTDVLSGFDLTCCSAAVTRDGRVWAHPDFRAHATEKKIVVLRDPKPASTAARIERLKARGYTGGAA